MSRAPAFLRGLLAVLALCATAPAMAWDAGPGSCVHSPCTGGVGSDSVLDTRPKWANSEVHGRLADCPAGCTNTGVATCGCGVSTIAVEASRLGSCRSGYYNNGTTCWRDVSMLGAGHFSCGPGERLGGGLLANKCFPQTATNAGPCSEDRDEYGVSGASLCFTKCPPNSTRTALSTCVHHIRWHGNTHLFIILNALDLLARETGDPVAQAAVQALRDSPACRTRWEEGLWNMDYGDDADSPPPARPAATSTTPAAGTRRATPPAP